jgi:hypothetical protein
MTATDLLFQVQSIGNLANWFSNNRTDPAVATNSTTGIPNGSLPPNSSNQLFLPPVLA